MRGIVHITTNEFFNRQNTNPDSPMHSKIASNASNIELLKQASSSLNNSSTESAPHSEQQLKYENERLKLALAQR